MSAGIYAIVDRTGRRYVGQSDYMEQRFEWHRFRLMRGTHHCVALQHAWNSDKPDKIHEWQWVFLFVVGGGIEIDKRVTLDSLEHYYINNSKYGHYNTAGVRGEPNV